MAFAPWDIDVKDKNVIALDVREDIELQAFTLPAYQQIPLGQLRKRLDELDRDKEIVTFCAIGVRAYNAARILMENGFRNVKVYPSGIRFYQSMHYNEYEVSSISKNVAVSDSGYAATPEAEVSIAASMRIDCSGLQCPGPILKVFEAMKDLKEGEILEVSASDPGFARDIGAWTRRTGNTLLFNEKRGKDYLALVKKTEGESTSSDNKADNDGKTIIVFSGDLDKVLASFIIANGAAAMGRKVTMFFTFWGLSALRKANRVKVSKTFVESMFGGMMPRGAGKLKLSKMNMLGMGSRLMKGIMKKKNVDSLEILIRKAQANGVKIIACTMSMDVMGLKEAELIDGIEYAGVGTYLGDAEESNVNLFI